MARWMLAEDLVTRPGEHPEQVEAAKEHLRMGGFEGYEKIDLTPQDQKDVLEWLEWRAAEGATSVDPRIIADALRKEGYYVTGREKLMAQGVAPESIVETKQNVFPRIEGGEVERINSAVEVHQRSEALRQAWEDCSKSEDEQNADLEKGLVDLSNALKHRPVSYERIFNTTHEHWNRLLAESLFDKPHDPVGNPSHYTKGGIQPIDYIESWGMDFRDANVIKYVTRAPHKGNELQDLKKARWYIDRRIAELEVEESE